MYNLRSCRPSDRAISTSGSGTCRPLPACNSGWVADSAVTCPLSSQHYTSGSTCPYDRARNLYLLSTPVIVGSRGTLRRSPTGETLSLAGSCTKRMSSAHTCGLRNVARRWGL